MGAKRITALVERDHLWATGFWDAVGYGLDAGMARYVRNLQSTPPRRWLTKGGCTTNLRADDRALGAGRFAHCTNIGMTTPSCEKGCARFHVVLSF